MEDPKPGERYTFITPFEQYRDRQHQTFTVIRPTRESDGYDTENAIDSTLVRFDDGVELHVWSSEFGVRLTP